MSSSPSARHGECCNQAKVEADKSPSRTMPATAAATDDRTSTIYPPDDPGVVQVHYEVQERPPAKVGQIIIVGNTVTRTERHPARRCRVYPGQILSCPTCAVPSATWPGSTSSRPSPKTGIRPTVTVLDPDSDSQFKDILVNVKETQTGSLMFGVGVNSDAGLTGSIVLNERNFDIFRVADQLRRLLERPGLPRRRPGVPRRGRARHAAAALHRQLPRAVPVRQPVQPGVSGYYYDRVLQRIQRERARRPRHARPQAQRSTGASSAAVRVENVGVSNVPLVRSARLHDVVGQQLPGRLPGRRHLRHPRFVPAADRGQHGRRRRSSRCSATSPSRSSTSRRASTSRVYQRADGSGRHVLAARSQVVAGPATNTPVFERFFAGGFRSMRGFEFRGVGPDVNGFKVGGDFMFLNSLEYQIPILANDQLYVVGFVDSGTVETQRRASRTTACRPASASASSCRCWARCRSPSTSASRSSRRRRDREQVFSFWVGFFR